jgi:hypothetical protein
MTTGFRVHAYLARITPPPHWRPAAGEIAGIVTPTVRALTDPSSRQQRKLSFPTWPPAGASSACDSTRASSSGVSHYGSSTRCCPVCWRASGGSEVWGRRDTRRPVARLGGAFEERERIL